jgi:hypothetical protein
MCEQAEKNNEELALKIVETARAQRFVDTLARRQPYSYGHVQTRTAPLDVVDRAGFKKGRRQRSTALRATGSRVSQRKDGIMIRFNPTAS